MSGIALAYPLSVNGNPVWSNGVWWTRDPRGVYLVMDNVTQQWNPWGPDSGAVPPEELSNAYDATGLNVGGYGPPLSTGPFLLLLADRVVQWKTSAGEEGYQLPCRPVEVRVDQLADLLMAWSVWNLAARNLVALVPDQSGSTVFVHLTRFSRLPGIEGRLLHLLVTQPVEIEALVKRWFGRKVDDPSSEVVTAVDNEVRYWANSTGRNPCSELRLFEQEFARLAAGWAGFYQMHPAVARPLFDGCGRAIKGQARSQNDPGDESHPIDHA